MPTAPWVLILAGGDGARLKPLTRAITGDPRPRQFCPLLSGETLLDRTRRRVDLLAPSDHQVVVVTQSHAVYYRSLVGDLAPVAWSFSPRIVARDPACCTRCCESASSREMPQ